MEIVNYTDARKNFSATMDRVCDGHIPVAITRKNGKPVVMLSLEDYNAWEETMYLLRSEANRSRILGAIRDIEKGQYETKDLIDEQE